MRNMFKGGINWQTRSYCATSDTLWKVKVEFHNEIVSMEWPPPFPRFAVPQGHMPITMISRRSFRTAFTLCRGGGVRRKSRRPESGRYKVDPTIVVLLRDSPTACALYRRSPTVLSF